MHSVIILQPPVCQFTEYSITSFIYAIIHSCMPSVYPPIVNLFHLFIRCPIRSFTRSPIHSRSLFVLSLMHSLRIVSVTRPLSHSLIHTCMPFIYRSIHPLIHALHPPARPRVCPSIHPYIRSFTPSSVSPCIYSIHSFLYLIISPFHPPIYPSIHPSMHSLTHSSTHPCTH
jgi:hypothetical protein